MHKVTVTTTSLALTDGNTYSSGAVVYLSDTQFQDMTHTQIAGVTDGGEVVGPYLITASTSQVLLVERGQRYGAVITNTGTTVLDIAYGSAVTTSLYSFAIAAGATWTEPYPGISNEIVGIWVGSSTGGAMVTVL